MFRKIDIWYSICDEEVTFDITETTSVNWKYTSYTYKIKDFKDYKDWTNLYDKVLDDFEADFDDSLSRGLEDIIKLFWKEKDKYVI